MRRARRRAHPRTGPAPGTWEHGSGNSPRPHRRCTHGCERATGTSTASTTPAEPGTSTAAYAQDRPTKTTPHPQSGSAGLGALPVCGCVGLGVCVLTRRFVPLREGSYVLVGDSYFLATVRTVGVRSVAGSAESLVPSAEPSREVPNRHPVRAGEHARPAPRALTPAPGAWRVGHQDRRRASSMAAAPVQHPDDPNGPDESAQASTTHRQQPHQPGNDHPHRSPDPNHHTHKPEEPD